MELKSLTLNGTTYDSFPFNLTEADKQEIAEQAAELVEVPEGSNVNPVAKTAEMTQPVGVDSEGKLFTKPGDGGGGENTETMTDFAGYTGMQFYDNGNVRAYNPIVNTTAWNERCRKVSALMQKAAESAPLASTEGVMAHESSMTFSGSTFGILSWVENVAGTAADVPGEAGITAVKGRLFLMGSTVNFPSSVPKLHGDNAFIIAQKGDSANNTITGEDFTIPGGVGYQTSIDGKVLCGYVPGYNKLAGLTCVTSVNAFEEFSVTSRHTWTLTIDGVLGEYNYSRLPAGLTGATLHPSNQIAKIGSTYYRADVVPNNGFVVFSSTDLINWTYIGHATFPEGFDDKSATEACCGAKAKRLYVAVRQAPESACLYLAKMNADMYTINSCVALPDCGSKPCFTAELNGGSNSGKSLFLATAPSDRYGCRVYNIPTDYSMTHIYPVFELHGVSCNYPFIFQVGVDPDWVIIAGTNGAQANKKGVSLVPAAIYDRIAGQIDIPADTDNIVHTTEGAITFGELYSSGNDGANGAADSELSAESENPVQNKVVKAALDEKADDSVVVKTVNGTAPDENGNVEVSASSGGGSDVWEHIETYTVTDGDTSHKTELSKTYKKFYIYMNSVYASGNSKFRVMADYEAVTWNGRILAQVDLTNSQYKYSNIEIEKIASNRIVTRQSNQGANLSTTNAFYWNVGQEKMAEEFLYFGLETDGVTLTGGTIEIFGVPA